jgi:hypothetical protein
VIKTLFNSLQETLYLQQQKPIRNMKSFLKTMILGVFLLVSSARLQAQVPPHPNNGGDAPAPGTNTPVGAGATLTDGSFILLALGLAYAGRKVYVAHSSKMVKE